MPDETRVIYLYGSDEYALSRRLAEYSAKFADPATGDMNTTRLDARSMTDEDLNNAVNALPFLSKQRLVLLGNPSARFSRRTHKGEEGEDPQAQDEAARERFLGVLENVPTTTLLLVWELTDAHSPSARGKGDQEEGSGDAQWLLKWIKKKNLGLEHFPQPEPRLMAGWILKEARAQKGEFSGPAAAKLAEFVGNDTRQAAQEITKLLTFVNWKRLVTPADVEALTPFTAEARIWDLVDALSQGNGRTGQSLLRRFIDNDGEYYVWAMIIRQFRLMLLAREVLDAGGGQKEAEAALHTKGFPVEKALKYASRFKTPRLEAIYHRLLEIDEAYKTGSVPLPVSLDMLVAELAA